MGGLEKRKVRAVQARSYRAAERRPQGPAATRRPAPAPQTLNPVVVLLGAALIGFGPALVALLATKL